MKRWINIHDSNYDHRIAWHSSDCDQAVQSVFSRQGEERWHGTACHDVARHSIAWHSIAWHSAAWHGIPTFESWQAAATRACCLLAVATVQGCAVGCTTAADTVNGGCHLSHS
jgi:hypothetical protein